MAKHRGKLPKGVFYPKGTEVLYVRYTNEYGKQVFESSKGNDKEAAEALLIRRKREVLGRKSPVAAAILGELAGKRKTFSDFLKEDYYPSVKDEPSYKERGYCLNKFAKETGHLLVHDINISHLLKYRNSQQVVTKEIDKDGNPITRKPSNATLNRHRAWILSCLSYAVTLGVFHKQALTSILSDDNYPKLPELKKNPRAYTVQQLHAILESAEKRNKELYQIIRFAIATGLRRGKIFSFKWSQVNWDTNEITSPPKNPKSIDWLVQPISEPVKTVLEERLKVKSSRIPYVFYNPKTMSKWTSLSRSWWHVLEDAGLRQRTDKQSMGIFERKNKKRLNEGLDALPVPERIDLGIDAVFHGLRHSFGSHLIDMNIPIITCMLLLGHSDIKTTEKYLKSLRGVQEYKKSLDKLGVLVDHKPDPEEQKQNEFLEWAATQTIVEDYNE